MEGVTQEVNAGTGHTPTLVGTGINRLNRWRAFYPSRVMVDPAGRNTGAGAFKFSSVHLIGKESHMYYFWFPHKLKGGYPLVLLATETIKLRPTCIARRFERLGPIETTVSWKNGKDTGMFYYRVGYGYKPSELEN